MADVSPRQTSIASPRLTSAVFSVPDERPVDPFVVGVLPGEGIGPEVMAVALELLNTLVSHTSIRFEQRHGGCIGVEAVRRTGQALSDEIAAFCQSIFNESGAVLCGPGGGRFVYDLRARFDLYCKLTPLRPSPALEDSGILRPERVRDADVIVVRENTSGLYFGSWGTDSGHGQQAAYQRCVYRESEVERILQVGLRLAEQRRGHLTLVTKPGGVPAISHLWQRKLDELAADGHVATRTLEIDNAVYQIITDAASFDVVVCPNMFGDVLGDGGSVLLGSRGMSYSGNFGATGRAVYQTAHGAAWDLAGTDRANPIGQIYSLTMMLRESCHLPEAATLIEQAVAVTLSRGIRTPDIAAADSHVVGTREMGYAICRELETRFAEGAL